MQICATGFLALLLSLICAVAQPLHYTYDAANRLVGVDYGGGRFIAFTYDANGNLLNRTTAVATNADVRVTKTSNVTGITAGLDFFYTVTVTNAGPDTATGVVLVDALPFGTVFKNANISQGSCVLSNHHVICHVGILPMNVPVSLVITAAHAFVANNAFTNVVTVSADQADPNLANNTATRVTSGLTGSAAGDSDGDGMPNWWEQLSGLSHLSSFGDNGANGDPDGDGVRNFDEWVADTDPRDPASFFHIEAFGVEDGMATLQFRTSAIRRYHAQFAPDVDTPFTNFLSFDGIGGLTTITHTNNGEGGVYRIEVVLP